LGWGVTEEPIWLGRSKTRTNRFRKCSIGRVDRAYGPEEFFIQTGLEQIRPGAQLNATFNAVGVSLMPRPNLNPGVPLELFGSGYPGGKILNRAAFNAPPAGQQGSFGRNVLRGFNATQADIGVHRVFRVTERMGLRFRAEFFNSLNHPNFGSPTNLLTSALFGRSTQPLANFLGAGGANGGFNPLYQIGGPRSIQLGLKLMF